MSDATSSNFEPTEAFPYSPPTEEIQKTFSHIFENKGATSY